MSNNTPDPWSAREAAHMTATARMLAATEADLQRRADPVLRELRALRADIDELKSYIMAPQTSLIVGPEAVAAFRQLQKGGAA